MNSIRFDKSLWEKTKLGDVVKHSTSSIDPNNGSITRYISGGHMDSSQLKISRWGEIGDGYLGPAFIRPFHAGDVLYGSRRTYLKKLAVPDFDGVCANTTLVLRTSNSEILIQDYLPLIMTQEEFHKFSIRESKGSVNPYVNWSDLAKFEFLLPPISVQRDIAALFWLIENSKNRLNNLLSILENDITPIYLREQLYMNSKLDYTKTNLLSLGKWSSGMTPKAGAQEFYKDGVYPFITIADLTGEKIEKSASYLTELGLVEAGGLVKAGAILISMYGTIGKVAIAGVPLATSQAIAAVEVDENICLARYLYYYLQSLKSEFKHEGRGATQMNINRKMITSKPILLPTIDEQKVIVESLDFMFLQIETVKTEIRSLENLSNKYLNSISEVAL